jgi:signal transduction histidine kinase
VPVISTHRLLGVITMLRDALGDPRRHELRLAELYAGYVASAVERERLLGEATTRNRVLETLQEVLETLAGPVPLARGVPVVLLALCAGLQADAVALVSRDHCDDPAESWSAVDASGAEVAPVPALHATARALLDAPPRDGKARLVETGDGGSLLAATFAAPAGTGVLLARWNDAAVPAEAMALIEGAANSLRLARERQESERAREEAAALRRSRELQRGFLSRLSHELRTPLTAIGGYASSLMAADVSWDGASERRFLSRIGAESARLNRLVDDLLDFSAIESSTMRLQLDWCDVAPVLDAAAACLPPDSQALIALDCAHDLPPIWADHDRLEQVFVNLLENALRHNPGGTHAWVTATGDEAGGVVVVVSDDGAGLPEEVASALFETRRRGVGPGAGAGLGLSIAKGIVDAHGGRIELEPAPRGTRFVVRLPTGGPGPSHRYAEDHELADA